MQSRWIAIGVVCFSAALLSACGGASGTALTSRSDASALSKTAGRYDTSKNDDKDECDESEDHDKSSDKSRSLSVKSKDSDDDKECKESDDHDKSWYGKSSRSVSMSSYNDDKDRDHDEDDDANCKVTVCHVPPGNHCNEHTIRVGKSAVPAHIAHGDYPGSCDAPPPTPTPPACFAETVACTATAECCSGLACTLGACAIAG